MNNGDIFENLGNIDEIEKLINGIFAGAGIAIIIMIVLAIMIIYAIIKTESNTALLNKQNEELKKKLDITNNQINFLCRYIGELAKKQGIIIPPPQQPQQQQKKETVIHWENIDVVGKLANKIEQKQTQKPKEEKYSVADKIAMKFEKKERP